MIGQSIHGSRSVTPGVVSAALLALCCVGFAVLTKGAGWWALAAIAASTAIAVLASPRPVFHWRIDAEALVDETTADQIPYESITAVYPCGLTYWKARPRNYALEIVHNGGSLFTPARISIPSPLLEEFLLHQLPESAASSDADIERYRQAQVGAFGAERVFSFAGRRSSAKVRSVAALWGCSAILLSSLLAGGVGVWMDDDSVMIVSVISAAVGLIALLSILLVGPSPHRRRMSASSLVISPLGFALSQEGLKGEIRWSEIRQVTYTGKSRKFGVVASDMRPAIHVQIAGVVLMIYDSYDHPLSWIHERIVQYWQ